MSMNGRRALCAMASVFLLVSGIVAAESVRPLWSTIEPPVIVSIEARSDNPRRLVVSFDLETSDAGADSAVVSMYDSQGKLLEQRPVGKSRRLTKKIEFEPNASGTYSFMVSALRKEEALAIESEPVQYRFMLPLDRPVVGLLNQGGGSLAISWQGVQEADGYEVSAIRLSDGEERRHAAGTGLSCLFEGLSIGERYAVTVAALRNGERSESDETIKTIREDRERPWNFTWFGQSTKADLNRIEMIDSDDMVFKLFSCTYNASNDQVDQKGGKFTAFHDGISFYYTTIDPRTENFELTATFEIDYINIVADGQEGFGLLALDSLGAYGVSGENHYTNSAGIIATKFEETVAGVKKTSKDTLGARFVTGITPEVLAMGDAGIALQGKSLSRAYSYDQADLVKAGDVYTITLKKTNTGYHAVYAKEYATEETVTEFVLYGPEKLQQLDVEHVYVGFAVARGCNATIRDVRFRVSDAASDPPAQAEPPELIPLEAKVDSPSTYAYPVYPFKFTANADGLLKVIDSDRRILIDNVPVKAFEDFATSFNLKRGINDYQVTFSVDPAYRPGERQVMARYDRELRAYVEDYRPLSISHTVIHLTYEGRELYASPSGSPFGRGTQSDPLDIVSALNYVKPGQTVLLSGGTYWPSRAIVIERGNNGTGTEPKMVRTASDERAVLDFGSSGGGMQLWGDHWIIEGIDITNTGDNVKGLQIAGNHNIIRNVRTYGCGDTGMQISGSSTERKDKWPSYNLVESCVSYDNCDPAANNADGFAAKLTSGEGNVFRSCIAYSNIDDGWDLYTKIDSGPIGAVLIERCVAFHNGSLLDGWGNGDGNGFKLGGDGIVVEHVLRDSIAYANGNVGITSNSNPTIVVERCTSYGNNGSNVALYGKGEGVRAFKVTGLLSMQGSIGDNYREMPALASPDNFFWDGAACVNSSGQTLQRDAFLSTDMTVLPSLASDGSIDMHGLFVPAGTVPARLGARW